MAVVASSISIPTPQGGWVQIATMLNDVTGIHTIVTTV